MLCFIKRKSQGYDFRARNSEVGVEPQQARAEASLLFIMVILYNKFYLRHGIGSWEGIRGREREGEKRRRGEKKNPRKLEVIKREAGVQMRREKDTEVPESGDLAEKH